MTFKAGLFDVIFLLDILFSFFAVKKLEGIYFKRRQKFNLVFSIQINRYSVKNISLPLRMIYWRTCLREALRKKTGYFMTMCQRVGRQQSQNMISFLKRNYDKRVDARIISQIIITMNNSLFIEKQLSISTVNTFTQIVSHISSEHYYFVCIFLMNLNFIEFKMPVYLLFH